MELPITSIQIILINRDLVKTDKNQNTLEVLEYLLELKPEYGISYYLRGLLHNEMNHTDPAIEDLEKALTIEPDNERYLRNPSTCRRLPTK